MTVTAGTVGLGVAQFAPTGDTAQNLRVIGDLVGKASDRGADVVVLPEYSSFFVHPFDESLAAHAESLDGSFVHSLIALAADFDIHLVAGLTERAVGDRRPHNTVVAVDGSGILARYRKMHLYDAFGQRESDWIAAGEIAEPETFVVGGLRLGMMTCYDLRFPEVTRRLADAGADAVLVPSEWVAGPLKEHHWRTLLTARAIENTVYVAAADHPPPLGVGLSMIIDPQGVEVAGVSTATDVAVAYPSGDVIERVRRVNPALALRRFRVTEK